MVQRPSKAARRAGFAFAWLVGGALCGCEARADSARVLRLSQVRPQNAAGVYLNESLVFHFDAELDPASVTRRSVRIAAVDGRSPRGALVVEGDELRFEPAPVLAPTLDDGGYQPDTEYTVRLLGFPAPDGLRSIDGAPLANGTEWRFRTVSVAEPRSGAVFEDRSPEVGRPLQLESRDPLRIPPTGPIEIDGGEPIDPSSLRAEHFQLCPIAPGADGTRLGDPIPLRAVLADNRDPLDYVARGRTIVQLVPQTVLAAGRYALSNLAPADLHDFGGHPVWPFSIKRLHVVVEAGAGATEVGSHVESFLDTDLRSPADVSAADGTAWWSGNGRIEVRYPAVALESNLGNVVLSGDETRTDITARQIDVVAGETASFGVAPGLVVLCAERRLTIAGTLVRETPGGFGEVAIQQTLSEWLADERQRDAELRGAAAGVRSSMTVLIAGGDLTISGRLRVGGPVCLIAGGRIRISGEIEGPGPDGRPLVLGATYYHGKLDGGMVVIDWGIGREPRYPRVLGAAELPWVMDPPRYAPRAGKEKLVFQVLSAAIPPQGGVARWRSGAVVHGFSGNRGGSVPAGESPYRVRFIGASASGASEVLVDDPALFAEAKSVRLLLELTVYPARANAEGAPTPAWDPPWIDDVALFWESNADGGR